MNVDALFINLGFIRSYVDHSLYIKQISEYLMIVIVYIDDLIIITKNMRKKEEVKAILKKEYDMSDLGELHYCIEEEFQRQWVACTITISQSKYIEKVLKHLNMDGYKAIGRLIDVKSKILKLMNEEFKV